MRAELPGRMRAVGPNARQGRQPAHPLEGAEGPRRPHQDTPIHVPRSGGAQCQRQECPKHAHRCRAVQERASLFANPEVPRWKVHEVLFVLLVIQEVARAKRGNVLCRCRRGRQNEPGRGLELHPAVAGEIGLAPRVAVHVPYDPLAAGLIQDARRVPRHQPGGHPGAPQHHRHGGAKVLAVPSLGLEEEIVDAIRVERRRVDLLVVRILPEVLLDGHGLFVGCLGARRHLLGHVAHPQRQVVWKLQVGVRHPARVEGAGVLKLLRGRRRH